MLVNLHAKNFVIIDEIDVAFGEQFNVISGETGAGKSVIIGSIGAALGGKVSKDIVRTGADFALVELQFQSASDGLKSVMKKHELDYDGSEVILSRKITSEGKSVFRINGETVNATIVKEIAQELIDIHGQHEHQSLLKQAKQLELLDQYSSEELEPVKETIKKLYSEYNSLHKELQESMVDEEKRLRELSFLQYELNEIREARLIPGEEEELKQEYKKLSNANTINEVLASVYRLTGDGNGAVAEQIGYALQQLGKVTDFDDALGSYYDMLAQTEDLIRDFNREISDYIDSADVDGERFELVEKRMDLINHMTARYGATIEKVLEHADECEAMIEKYENYDRYRSELEKKCNLIQGKLDKACLEATKIRKNNAKKLENQLIEALQDLNFLDVKLQIAFSETGSYTALGKDEIEFMISTNPGEPMHPLAKVASGGELSRIMLALKSVLSGRDEIDTMIFDEIDVGVSGRTAQMVSEKMTQIAVDRQLLCITHLPQIAAMADQHFIIEKSTDGQTTTTQIRVLDKDGEISEIARMLGGVEVTGKVIDSAKEMKSMANKKKKELKKMAD